RVCAGRTALAMPSCATAATRMACSLVSRASVTTAPIVVLPPGIIGDEQSQAVSGATHSCRSSSQIPPRLLATITAATTAPPAFALATPTPPRRGSLPPALATLAPGPAPTPPRPGLGGAAAPAAEPAAGPGRGARITGQQVETHRTGHNRHRDGAEHQPDAPFFEVTQHPADGGQAERAAAGQQDGVRPLGDGARAQAVGVDRAGGPAPDV